MDDSATLAFANLQPDDMLAALEDLGFRCDGRFLALNSYENRVYQVNLEDDAPIVAKFYRPGRWTDAAIQEEHDFTWELADDEIPVVAPLELEGETLHHSSEFRICVYPRRGGRAPELDDLDQLDQIGRLVARIHNVGETADFDHRPRLDIDSYAIDSRDYLLNAEFVPEDILDAYESIADLVIDGVESCFERAGRVEEIRLHADFHPSNLLVANDAFHIVDFDDTRSGPAVQDLWMFMSGDRTEQTPQLSALLDGYQSFRQFNARELHLVEALRSLRIMHYAAWLARRWEDPAFKHAFPWFDSRRYWDDHILALREQVALMQEGPLEWRDF